VKEWRILKLTLYTKRWRFSRFNDSNTAFRRTFLSRSDTYRQRPGQLDPVATPRHTNNDNDYITIGSVSWSVSSLYWPLEWTLTASCHRLKHSLYSSVWFLLYQGKRNEMCKEGQSVLCCERRQALCHFRGACRQLSELRPLNRWAVYCGFYVWLTVHLELYLCNKPTRCTIYLHFIELPHLYIFRTHL
jgi:hypothetical protein